jgi:hypothetical protein
VFIRDIDLNIFFLSPWVNLALWNEFERLPTFQLLDYLRIGIDALILLSKLGKI